MDHIATAGHCKEHRHRWPRIGPMETVRIDEKDLEPEVYVDDICTATGTQILNGCNGSHAVVNQRQLPSDPVMVSANGR